MLSNIPQFVKTVIVSGLDMLRTMGMTRDIISDELKEMMERAEEGKPLFIEKNSEQIEKEKEILPLSKKQKEAIKVTD
jgi:translation initiation factor 2B subunit (eIF-2B alpha/beta/delta family)